MHDAVSAMAGGEKLQTRKAAAAGFGAAIRVHLAWAEPDALATSHRGDEKPPPLSHFPHAPQIRLSCSSTAMTCHASVRHNRVSIRKRKGLGMASLSQLLADNPALKSMTSRTQQNVAPVERIASAAIGAAAIGYGLSRWSIGSLLLAAIGGGLVHRGISGHCYAYDVLGINTRERNTCAGTRGTDGIKVTQSVTIGRSPAEVYQFWRRLENLPRFMKHVETVEPIDELRSRWVVKGPAGSQVEWMAKILADRENEVISWESLAGAEVQNAGSVWFEPANNRGTQVKVLLRYYPPTGRVGAAVAELFGEAPDQQLAEDLQRLKRALEVDLLR